MNEILYALGGAVVYAAACFWFGWWVHSLSTRATVAEAELALSEAAHARRTTAETVAGTAATSRWTALSEPDSARRIDGLLSTLPGMADASAGSSGAD